MSEHVTQPSQHDRLLYADEHSQCCSYDKPGGDSMAQILDLREGELYEHELKETEVAFLYRGEISLSYRGALQQALSKRHLMLLPPGSHLRVSAIADSRIFIIRLSPEVQYCETLRFREAEESVEHDEDTLHTLSFNAPIERYLDSFIPCVEDGLRCTHFLQLKISELMYLLRAYYPKAEMAAFFQPVVGEENLFRLFVYKNASSCQSIGELAQKANMSEDGFLRKFKRVMKMNPNEFITKIKSDRVRYSLLCTDLPIKVISDNHGFATASGFVKFCKRNFGMTPAQMRSPDKKTVKKEANSGAG